MGIGFNRFEILKLREKNRNLIKVHKAIEKNYV